MLSNIIYNILQNNSFPLEAFENRRDPSLDRKMMCHVLEEGKDDSFLVLNSDIL
jgi:hypothetical protein